MVEVRGFRQQQGFLWISCPSQGPSRHLIKQHYRHLRHLRRSSSSLLNKHNF